VFVGLCVRLSPTVNDRLRPTAHTWVRSFLLSSLPLRERSGLLHNTMSAEYGGSQAPQKETPVSLFLGVLEEVIAEEQTNIADTGLEEIQYLHVRNALSVRFNRRNLTTVEKSLVNNRLLHFVPVALTSMQNFLLRNGALDMEGVFRVAPSNKVFAGALAQCEEANATGLPPHFLQESLSTSITIAAQRQQLITTVSSLYKMFIRRMKEPLLSREVFEDIAVFMPLADRLRASYPKLLAKIAPRRLRCLRHILRFLRTVAQRKDTNRMSANNLARIFAPSLVPASSQPEPDEPTMEFMLQLQRESDWQILSVQMLIEDQDDIFDEVDDILATRAEEAFLTTGSVPTEGDIYAGTMFDVELRGKWYFPPAPESSAELAQRRKKERAAKASSSKSLRQIGMDFRKVMGQIQVFNDAAELDNGANGGGGGGGGGAAAGGGGAKKDGDGNGNNEENNRANYCMEFMEWPLPFAIGNVASAGSEDDPDDAAELGMLCITAVRPVPPKAPVKPHWRLEKNDGVRLINDLDVSKMSSAGAQ
jgi:hypothetical protein